MLPSIEKLLTLQDRDQKLRTICTEIVTLSAEQDAHDRELKDADNHLKNLLSQQRASEIERKKLEIEVQTKQDQVKRYKTQQLETRKNAEFSALRHEIEIVEKEIIKLEDSQLQLMEEGERLQVAIHEAHEIRATTQGKISSFMASSSMKIKNLQERKQKLEEDRHRCTEGIDEDLLERYMRLFKNKNGTPLVVIEHEVCTGCHIKVTQQVILEVKAEKIIVACPHCGRILYEPQ